MQLVHHNSRCCIDSQHRRPATPPAVDDTLGLGITAAEHARAAR